MTPQNLGTGPMDLHEKNDVQWMRLLADNYGGPKYKPNKSKDPSI